MNRDSSSTSSPSTAGCWRSARIAEAIRDGLLDEGLAEIRTALHARDQQRRVEVLRLVKEVCGQGTGRTMNVLLNWLRWRTSSAKMLKPIGLQYGITPGPKESPDNFAKRLVQVLSIDYLDSLVVEMLVE
jgi:hypothetical protein